MTEQIVSCKNCSNLYYNPSNNGIYCGAYIEGKQMLHIVDEYQRDDGKWVDVFDCEEYKEQAQLKMDFRRFDEGGKE